MDFPHWAWTEADANYLRVALLTQAVRKRHFDATQKVLSLISKTSQNKRNDIMFQPVNVILWVILLIGQATNLLAGINICGSNLGVPVA